MSRLLPAKPVRVLVVAEPALMRQGVGALLLASGGFEVVGEAADGHGAVQQSLRLRPDIVLLDVELPGLDAVEVIQRITATSLKSASRIEALEGLVVAGGGSRVLPLGTSGAVAHLSDYLVAGAAGLLLKSATAAELVGALHAVARGGRCVSPVVDQDVLHSWHPMAERPRQGAKNRAGSGPALSERERELMECVAAGLANRHIAARLCISVKTVESHKTRIVAKLGLRGTAELMRVALLSTTP
ncbi:MAG: response regulator transcription factor [Chloroflexota bacterium]|nr:response regulator transcription factor [Chloroflexota bacterium]